MDNIFNTLGDHKSYEINKLGQVRNKKSNKILKNYLYGTKYYYTLLYEKGKKIKCYVHRLLCETFIENPFNYKCVNHKNGIKTDNSLENLEWCTYSQNMIHSYEKCFHKKGNLHQWSKLTEDLVREIVSLLETKKYTHKEIAAKFNVSKGTISDIKRKKSWRHLYK